MAYQTGTAATLTDLMDQLVAFMTANGWVLHDTISATDKVLKSNGTGSKLDMYYRLTTSEDAGYPYKNKPSAALAFKYLTVRGYGYWNAVTHVGIGEYGYGGSTLSTNKNNNVGYNYRLDSSSYPIVSTLIQDIINGPRNIWDGRRKWLWSSTDYNNAQPYITDRFGNRVTFPWNGINSHYDCGQPALVHDYATDKDFLYWMAYTSTLPDQFWRQDVETGAWTKLVQPSWSAALTHGSAGVWDGGDYLYFMRGSDSTEFARFQISTNTWTNRAALPINGRSSLRMVDANMSGARMLYVSKEMTGLAEDVIYAICELNPYNGAANIYYRYDVTSNAWRTTGSGGLALQTGFSAWMHTDHKRYLYVNSQNNDPNIYRGDLTQQPTPGLTNLGAHDTLGTGTWRSAQFTETLVGKVRAHNSLTCKYHFQGDTDGISVVTQVFTSLTVSRNYWMNFGKYQSAFQDEIMNITGPVSPGPRQTIPVDSTAGFFAGQYIQLYDPTTGNTELVSIYDVLNATSFRATVTKSYTTGSRAGVDPCQYGISSDHGISSLPNTPKGAKFDFESDWYFCGPAEPSGILNSRTPSARGQYQPAQMKMWNDYAWNGNSKREVRGVLRNVFVTGKVSYPGPVDGDIIKVEGVNYKAFVVSEADRITASQHMIVIGPV